MPVIRHKYTCFTFNTPVLPSAIKMHSLGLIVRGTFRIHVAVYIANNMVNHEVKCKNDPVCTRCGQPAINHASLHKKNPTKCAKCGESHDANSKEYTTWQKEKEIFRVKFIRNISFLRRGKQSSQQLLSLVLVIPILLN